MKYKVSPNEIVEPLNMVEIHLNGNAFSFLYLKMIEYKKNKFGYRQIDSKAYYPQDISSEMAEVAVAIRKLELVLANHIQQKFHAEFKDLVINEEV